MADKRRFVVKYAPQKEDSMKCPFMNETSKFPIWDGCEAEIGEVKGLFINRK